MKKIWNTLFVAFIISCLFLFKPREDVVFGAINKSQSIRLFEKNQDFELYIEEDYTFTGSYLISRDTVFLYYREYDGLTARALPEKLYITEGEGVPTIKSIDDESFSAEIYLDLRQKALHADTKSKRKSIPKEERIYAHGEQKETQSAL